MKTLWRLPAAGVLAAVLAASAACGDGGEGDDVASDLTLVPAGTPGVVGTPTPLSAAAQTVIAAGPNVPLVPYSDVHGRYTVQVPEGWIVEENRDESALFSMPGDFAVTLTIIYLPGETLNGMLDIDGRLQAVVGGEFGNAVRSPGKVGSIDALRVSLRTNLDTLARPAELLYFEGKGGGWRLGITTWHGVDIETMLPLLDRVAETFAFTPDA